MYGMRYLILFSILCACLQGNEIQKGIELLKQKKYSQASEQLQAAAKSGHPDAIFATAICEVVLGKQEAAAYHLEQLICLPCEQCGQNETDLPNTPQTPAAAYECRIRVRKVLLKMRNLVEKIVSESVPGLLRKIQAFRQLNPYIDMLARNGLACCQNQNVESCTEPLVEQLKLWDSEGLGLVKY
jgi:hypothetical protein